MCQAEVIYTLCTYKVWIECPLLGGFKTSIPNVLEMIVCSTLVFCDRIRLRPETMSQPNCLHPASQKNGVIYSSWKVHATVPTNMGLYWPLNSNLPFGQIPVGISHGTRKKRIFPNNRSWHITNLLKNLQIPCFNGQGFPKKETGNRLPTHDFSEEICLCKMSTSKAAILRSPRGRNLRCFTPWKPTQKKFCLEKALFWRLTLKNRRHSGSRYLLVC